MFFSATSYLVGSNYLRAVPVSWVQLHLIGAIRYCHVMYKLLYPSIRVRTAPPVSVRVRVSFSYGVTLLLILFLNLGPPFPGLPIRVYRVRVRVSF